MKIFSTKETKYNHFFTKNKMNENLISNQIIVETIISFYEKCY